MSIYINQMVAKPMKSLVLLAAILLSVTSCNVFEDEFKQDKQLAYYRYIAQAIPDSIASNLGKIEAYNLLIEMAKGDEELITPRKKNKLLCEIYTQLTGEYFVKRDINQALVCISQAVKLDAANEHAWYNRAYIYQTQGQDSLAVLDYNRALSNNDKYTDCYYNRGIIYEKKEAYQLAIDDYSRAIKLNPGYKADVYNNRGNVFQLLEVYDKAIDDYNAALAIDSSIMAVYSNREEALKDYRKIIKSDTTNTIVQNIISSIEKDL